MSYVFQELHRGSNRYLADLLRSRGTLKEEGSIIHSCLKLAILVKAIHHNGKR